MPERLRCDFCDRKDLSVVRILIIKGKEFNECFHCLTKKLYNEIINPLSQKEKKKIFERDGNRCMMCKRSKELAPLDISPIIPLTQGGTNHANNFISLCPYCKMREEMQEKQFESQ